MKASALVGGEFLNRLNYYANAWLPARDLVAAALNKRTEVESNGKIILFEQFAPWKVCLSFLSDYAVLLPTV